MGLLEITLPAMGEGITDATVIKWLVEEGEQVEKDQPVVEIATDKVDSEITAPEDGILKNIIAREGDIPKVGELLAELETDKVEDKVSGKNTFVEVPKSIEEKEEGLKKQIVHETEVALNVESKFEIPTYKKDLSKKFISPFIRHMAKENNISLKELSSIKGTGADGKIVRDDLLAFLKSKTKSGNGKSLTGEFEGSIANKNGSANGNGGPANGRIEIVEMDRMRKLIAQHMIHSVQTSPHVTSFAEADITELVIWRNKWKNKFVEKHNQRLTFTPLFIEAINKSIKDYPLINSSVDGDKILIKKDINIGMATALTNGNLIVPVIKNADMLTLQGLAGKVNELADRARKNKLSPLEVKGGTFTITNIGSFGNTTGTPIINQPEVAILAVGSIVRKPAVVKTEYGESIGIRDMITLSLTYDHRVIDGSLGGLFLKRISEYLENFDTSREI